MIRAAHWIAASAALALLAAGTALSAAEPLAVVVSIQRPVEPIETDTLALIYLRKKQLWQDGRRIQPVNLPTGDPVRRQFSNAVLELEANALDDYWNEQYFHGVMPPHVVQSPAAMVRFVAQTEGAIGYLQYCDVPATLRTVFVVMPDGRVRRPSQADISCPITPADQASE